MMSNFTKVKVANKFTLSIVNECYIQLTINFKIMSELEIIQYDEHKKTALPTPTFQALNSNIYNKIQSHHKIIVILRCIYFKMIEMRNATRTY